MILRIPQPQGLDLRQIRVHWPACRRTPRPPPSRRPRPTRPPAAATGSRPATRARSAPRPPGGPRSTSRSSAPASRGCGRRSACSRPTRRCASPSSRRTGSAPGASGRNGGFCAASLTHGLGNGLLHFPGEIDVLEEEGRRNLEELVAFVREEAIDCDLEPTGVLDVATEPWQVPELRGVGRAVGTPRDGARVPGPRGGAGGGPLATLPRRRPGRRRPDRDAQPGQAGLGPRRGGRATGRGHRRAKPGDGARPPGGRRPRSRRGPGRRSTPRTWWSRRPRTAPGSGDSRRCSCPCTTTPS